MKRKEQIQDAAADHRDWVCCGFIDPIADAREESFAEGAEWADEHPKEGMISLDKVCSWIDNVDIGKYLSCLFSGTVNISFLSNDFIRDLKKAMEE